MEHVIRRLRPLQSTVYFTGLPKNPWTTHSRLAKRYAPGDSRANRDLGTARSHALPGETVEMVHILDVSNPSRTRI